MEQKITVLIHMFAGRACISAIVRLVLSLTIDHKDQTCKFANPLLPLIITFTHSIQTKREHCTPYLMGLSRNQHSSRQRLHTVANAIIHGLDQTRAPILPQQIPRRRPHYCQGQQLQHSHSWSQKSKTKIVFQPRKCRALTRRRGCDYDRRSHDHR